MDQAETPSTTPAFDPADERTFDAPGHPIRYLVKKGHAKRLLVVFSGFAPTDQQRYNYLRSLDGVAAHRMYVLDDLGPRGCYYLGSDRDLFVARGVEAAIRAELERLGLGPGAAITAGSSKGGSAAVLFALRLGCRALAGAPQYRIGDYCTKEAAAVAVARLIAGGSKPDDVEWLNGVLAAAIREARPGADIEVFSSPDDDQFEPHVRPLLDELDGNGVPQRLTLGDYGQHRSVYSQYAPWMRARVDELCGETSAGRRLPWSRRGAGGESR